MHQFRSPQRGIESSFAWARLAVVVVLGTIGTVGMWSMPVVLPSVQAGFAAGRAEASLPFTLAMLGFAFGGIPMGRLSDRFGAAAPVGCGALALGAGYVGAGLAPSLSVFALMHLLIGLGASATFGPLMADTSRWFTRRRGIAVALAGCGNYLGGAVWPPLLQHLVSNEGWRTTHIGVGLFCAASMLPFLAILAPRAPVPELAAASPLPDHIKLGLAPNTLQLLLCIAGVGCCVAMSMPQVHIVAYCGDLGYGVARGAEMLSLMLGFGLVSRIGSGFAADRIGGAMTLLLGSSLQGVALFLYLWFDGLTSLYVISALFGLFQGGIVPMYAILVRQYFPPLEAGTRLGVVLMATLLGMALGGWMSGMIFDLTGSYRAAFLNGLMWNLVNVSIVLWLIMRSGAGSLVEALSRHRVQRLPRRSLQQRAQLQPDVGELDLKRAPP
jgi:MFS family permease